MNAPKANDYMTCLQMEKRLNEEGVAADDSFVKTMRKALGWSGKNVTVEEFEHTWASGAPEMRRKRRPKLTADEWAMMDEMLKAGKLSQVAIALACGVCPALVSKRVRRKRGPQI